MGADFGDRSAFRYGFIFPFPRKIRKGKMVLYLCMLPVLLRFLWGRGMFNLQYAFYWSVFEWCMVLLYVAIGLCIWTLADPLVFEGISCCR